MIVCHYHYKGVRTNDIYMDTPWRYQPNRKRKMPPGRLYCVRGKPGRGHAAQSWYGKRISYKQAVQIWGRAYVKRIKGLPTGQPRMKYSGGTRRAA